jgi:large subunit ribosomal protein L19
MSLIEDLGIQHGKDQLPAVHVGDTVEVHYLIKEGEKERVQLFTGTVLSVQGRGIAKAIVVRRIVQGEGVERIFPLHSPRVKDVQISRRGKVRQARLYYLRDRVGKQTRVTELVGEKARRHKQPKTEPKAEIPPPPPTTEDDAPTDDAPAAVEV